MYSDLLVWVFGLTALCSGSMVILSKSPVHSVYFLVLVFLNGANILLLLGADFLAMLFLVVYVGAIAILFLFVVMMLQINTLTETLFRYLVVGSFLGVLFLLETIMITYTNLLPSGALVTTQSFWWEDRILISSNIEALGKLLYTHMFVVFLLASLVLLLAMIGAIVLTMHKRVNVKRQLSLDYN